MHKKRDRNPKLKHEWKVADNKYECPHCGRIFTKYGICTHIWRTHGNGKDFDPNIGYKEGKRVAWNKGKTEHADVRIKKAADKLRNSIKEGHYVPWQLGTKISEETKRNISKAMKKAVKENPDSYSKNNVCGRVKHYHYKGHKLKGKWELATAKWLDSQKIKWENEPHSFEYIWKEETRLYFPDFYLPKHNIYIEVKGYKTKKDEAKWFYFPQRLVIIDHSVINELDNLTLNELINLKEYKSGL